MIEFEILIEFEFVILIELEEGCIELEEGGVMISNCFKISIICG